MGSSSKRSKEKFLTMEGIVNGSASASSLCALDRNARSFGVLSVT